MHAVPRNGFFGCWDHIPERTTMRRLCSPAQCHSIIGRKYIIDDVVDIRECDTVAQVPLFGLFDSRAVAMIVKGWGMKVVEELHVASIPDLFNPLAHQFHIGLG